MTVSSSQAPVVLHNHTRTALNPSHTVRCLDHDTAGDCIGRTQERERWFRKTALKDRDAKWSVTLDDDDVYYYINEDDERLKLEGETEKMGVCAKERKGITARYYG